MLRTYKILLLGSQRVGKTAIARRLAFDSFDSDHTTTIGAETYPVTASASGQEDCQILLIDTDHTIDAPKSGNRIPEGIDAALVIADSSRSVTVDTMNAWCALLASQYRDLLVVPVLNKTDLHQSAPEGRAADTSGPIALACSAKSGDGVAPLLRAVIARLDASEPNANGI